MEHPSPVVISRPLYRPSHIASTIHWNERIHIDVDQSSLRDIRTENGEVDVVGIPGAIPVAGSTDAPISPIGVIAVFRPSDETILQGRSTDELSPYTCRGKKQYREICPASVCQNYTNESIRI